MENNEINGKCDKNSSNNNIKEVNNQQNNLIINKNKDYCLNYQAILESVYSSQNDFSKCPINEYNLNVLLLSSEINRTNKLTSLTLLYNLSAYSFNINKIVYLFNKISKILSKHNEDDIQIKATLTIKLSQIMNSKKKNNFYSLKFINEIDKRMQSKISSSTLKNLEDNKNIIKTNLSEYIKNSRNKFFVSNKKFNKNLDLNSLNGLLEKIMTKSNKVEKDFGYIINQEWIIKTKIFVDGCIIAKREKTETYLYNEAFSEEKVYYDYYNMQDKIKANIYVNGIFPGPINNFNLIDYKDLWEDPINIDENYILAKNIHYSIVNQNDWKYLEEIFGVIGEIRCKIDKNNYIIVKSIIINNELSDNKFENLLNKRNIQINAKATVKDFEKKVIRCFYYALNKNGKNIDLKDLNNDDNELYTNNQIKFYIINKKNKNILIEIYTALTNNIKIYDSLYINQINIDKNNEQELLQDFLNSFYNKKEHILIIEILPKNNESFLQVITSEKNSKYKCSICEQEIKFKNKYICNKCNLSFFCCEECAKISGDHLKLHECLNKIFIPKFDLKNFLKEKLKTELKKDDPDQMRGLVGLENKGNDCYINCVLQCLSNTFDLMKYFLNDMYKKDISIDIIKNNLTSLSSKYHDLLYEMWFGDKLVIDTKNFFKNFEKKNYLKNYYNSSYIRDPMEFLTMFLNSLHEELKSEKIKKKSKNSLDYGLNMNGDLFWKSYKKSHDSIITDLFSSVFSNYIICSQCGKITMIYEEKKYLSLTIPDIKNILKIKYFSENECIINKYFYEKYSTIDDIKSKCMINIQEKIEKLLKTLSLCELLNISGYGEGDEKNLAYDLIFDSIETVIFDQKKMISRIITPKNFNEPQNQISEILKNGEEITFYETEILNGKYINIYVYPFCSKVDKNDINNKTILQNYPIVISVKKDLILDNLQYIIIDKITKLFTDDAIKNINKKNIDKNNLINIYYFHNTNNTKINCDLCHKKTATECYCYLFDYIKKNSTVEDLLKQIGKQEQPISLIAMSTYIDPEKKLYTISDTNSNNFLTLFDCLDFLIFEKTITMTLQCTECKTNQECKNKIYIYKPPLYLIIHLQRFTKNNQNDKNKKYFFSTKDSTTVKLPIILNMDKYVEGPEKNESIYELYGMILLKDNKSIIGGSHFSALCQNDGRWVMYDDKQLYDIKNVTGENAYIIFYKRKNN